MNVKFYSKKNQVKILFLYEIKPRTNKRLAYLVLLQTMLSILLQNVVKTMFTLSFTHELFLSREIYIDGRRKLRFTLTSVTKAKILITISKRITKNPMKTRHPRMFPHGI